MYIVGIDGGGTKTVGILTTETGEHLAQVESGPSNYHVVGAAEMQAVLENVIGELREKARILPTDAIRFCLGMAGLGRTEDRKIIGGICDKLGISESRILTHDAHIALVGGTAKQHGVIVISGTGAIVYGINADGREARSSGWGYLLGDEGSGYDIAIKGLRAVVRAADGRGSATGLTNRILDELELNAPDELIRWAHAVSRETIAELSKVVFDAARSSDTIAEQIVEDATTELVCAASSVIKQLAFDGTFDIVLSGGNLVHQPMFAEKLRCQFAQLAPNASVHLPIHDPAYGAVLLAQNSL